MLISLEWLREFVDLPDLGDLCELLQSAGLEVESVDDPRTVARGVVVGKVLTCEPHPNADKLKVTTVTDGSETFTVVCGAPNVEAGQLVPLARVGAQVGPLAIAARQVRDQPSQGMICSREELGLAARSEGIWVLPSKLELGQDIFTATGTEPVLTLGITPNRPDLLCHYGVAREVAAATKQRLKSPTWRVSEKGPEVGTQARIVVQDQNGCDRYLARVVLGVKVEPSPRWMRERLERVGQRAINNVVDATNYVLFEYGQPLHAFDLHTLAQESNLPTIRVRRAEGGERLTTLDDVERQLNPDDLLITDPNRPLALAGVMGGADSEVSESTTAVLIESAHFNPALVRRASKRHGLHTESSHRFERGADPQMVQRGADRCAQLLAETAGGAVCKGVIDVSVKAPPAPEIALRPQRVGKLLGVEFAPEKIVELLEPLDIRCSRRGEMALHFQVPSFRPDLTREVDLIEEVARRHGYNNIPERLPSAAGAYAYQPLVTGPDQVAREALLASGCAELVTFGFGSPQVYRDWSGEEPLTIQNPLGEEYSAMRTSLVPGLLAVAQHNQRHGESDLRLFEVGRTFHLRPADPETPERERGLPREVLRVAILVGGGRHRGAWYQGAQQVDFYDLSGVVEGLVEAFSLRGEYRLHPAEPPHLNPHVAARVRVGEKTVGVAGQLHPLVAKNWDLEGPLFVAELDLTLLNQLSKFQSKYRPLPRFPKTRRDIALLAPTSLAAADVMAFLSKEAGGELGPQVVERVRLFDVYRGEGIPEGKVSLAFAIDYRHPERTLTDQEVGLAFERLLQQVKEKLEVDIR